MKLPRLVQSVAGGCENILFDRFEMLLIPRLIKRSGRFLPLVLLLALPALFIFSLLRPIVLVRFGEIPTRLGHLTSDLDTYISLKKLKKSCQKRSIDFICKPNSEARINQALFAKFSESLTIWPRRLVVPFLILCNEINQFHEHRLAFTPKGKFEGELNYLIHQSPSPIKVESHEVDGITRALKSKGISIDHLVVLALRDAQFTQNTFKTDAEYSIHRNFDESQTKTLIQGLTTLGFRVIRAGSEALRLAQGDEILFWDYANSNLRSDKNDLAIFSLAKICIGMDTGLHNMALLFRKPLHLVSTPSFTNKLTSPLLRLVAYCNFTDERTGLSLNLKEMKDRGVFSATGYEDFKKIGVRPIRMPEKDILSFVSEVNQFEMGQWEESSESKNLKRAFLNYLEPYGFKRDSQFVFPNYWSKKSNWLS